MADARSISTPSSSTRAPPLGMRTSSRRARPASTHHVSFRDSGVYDEEAGAGGAFDEDEVRARGDALQAHTQSSRRGQANMTRSVSTANKTVNSEMVRLPVVAGACLWGVGCGSACACCLHARSVYTLTHHARY